MTTMTWITEEVFPGHWVAYNPLSQVRVWQNQQDGIWWAADPVPGAVNGSPRWQHHRHYPSREEAMRIEDEKYLENRKG